MTRSDSDSDIQQVKSIKSKNKENKSLTHSKSLSKSNNNYSNAMSEDEDPKQQISKRKVPTLTTANTNNKGKKSKKLESDNEEEVEEEDNAESEDDRMEINSKKSTSNKNSKKSTKNESIDVLEDGEEKTKLTGNEKRLRAKLDAKTEALKVAHAAFTKLKELRTTSAEDQLKTLTDLAAERQAVSYSMIQNYKSENDSLRTQLTALNVVPNPTTATSKNQLQSSTSSPVKGKSEDAIRVEQLLVANNALQVELTSFREKSERSEKKKLQERDIAWEKELESSLKSKDEELKSLKASLSTITQELEAEIQHSKTLQTKLKSTSTTLPLARHANGEEGAYKKLQEDHEDLKARLHLNEDCTGLMVNSFKRDAAGDTYSCVLSDLLQKTGTLAFNLTFNHDQSISYTPQVEGDRDAAITAIIPPAFTQYMRFDSQHTGPWFRELFKSVNNIKID